MPMLQISAEFSLSNPANHLTLSRQKCKERLPIPSPKRNKFQKKWSDRRLENAPANLFRDNHSDAKPCVPIHSSLARSLICQHAVLYSAHRNFVFALQRLKIKATTKANLLQSIILSSIMPIPAQFTNQEHGPLEETVHSHSSSS